MNKKKISLFTIISLLVVMFTACNTDSYTHQVSVTYPAGPQGFIYADQTVDSIQFITYDSYSYFPYGKNPDSFISVDEKNSSKKIMNSVYAGYIITLPVYFKPNTTDTVRLGYVLVDSKSEMDDWTGEVYGTYLQANWHCINRPAPKYEYNENGSLIVDVEHVMRDSAFQVADTISFYAYDKWTIASNDEDKIKPEITSGKIGWNKIPCEVSINITTDTLRTSLLITSENGAKSVIRFQQAPKKKQK